MEICEALPSLLELYSKLLKGGSNRGYIRAYSIGIIKGDTRSLDDG